jgi:hypothetical protein
MKRPVYIVAPLLIIRRGRAIYWCRGLKNRQSNILVSRTEERRLEKKNIKFEFRQISLFVHFNFRILYSLMCL